MKSISKPQHQIVGVFKLAQLIPYMQKQMACNVSLESQNLVEPFHITTAVYQVPTDADIDRENRHHASCQKGLQPHERRRTSDGTDCARTDQ